MNNAPPGQYGDEMGRVVLLSGACGSGKTTILRLGYRQLHRELGRTATLDTDWFLMLVDPLWELDHEERDFDLLFHQGALLARSFFDAGFDTVLIGGNALHTYGEFSPLITALGDRHEMFHFTLEPVLDAIIERVNKRGGDKTEDWLASHVEWMRTRPVGDTIRIDNTSLTPSETLAVIARHLADGEGLLSRVAGGP